MVPLLLTVAGLVVSHCHAFPGAEAFVVETKARWVLLGEAQHGTAEGPRAAADFVCAAIKTGRPVTVAVEYSSADQPLLDAFTASDGGPAARRALFRGFNWATDNADGKSSEAMLRFVDRLRIWRRLGSIRSVVAFDAAEASGNADRNRKMAAILEAIEPGKDGLVIALTGSYHAQRKTVLDRGAVVSPPGVLLPHDRTVSLLMEGEGGTAWVCKDRGCHVYPVARTGTGKRGLRLTETPDGRFDGVIDLGTTESASPPANKG